MPRSAQLNREQSQTIDVIVGILVDQNSRVLVAQRPEGKHMAGAWEFPGGKLDPDEQPIEGLRRELKEELGIAVGSAEPLIRHCFDYPDRSVRLDVWWVKEFAGEASSLEGQALRWVDAARLDTIAMLPADEPIVAAVQQRLSKSLSTEPAES